MTQYYAPGQYDPANLPWRVRPEIAGAGIFLDLASHTLDILDFLLGPVATAKGVAGNQADLYPAEDCVAASLAFASGTLATGIWCFTAYNQTSVDANEIVGSRGKLRFSTFGTEPIELTTAEGVSLHPAVTPPHIQQPLIQTIVNALRGGPPCPSTGDTALRTSVVMDAILRDWRAKEGARW
jgi:predicted dehydrogenase